MLCFDRCEICGEATRRKRTAEEVAKGVVLNGHKLFEDHCHETGLPRGLLCQHCNSMLGFARDETTILENAIKYLEKYRRLNEKIHGTASLVEALPEL